MGASSSIRRNRSSSNRGNRRDPSAQIPQLYGDQDLPNGYTQEQMQTLFMSNGVRPDLGFLLSQGLGTVPVMQQTYTIRNDVNLKKDTIQFEPSKLDPEKYIIKFKFDAAKRCSIQLYFVVKEILDTKTNTVNYIPIKQQCNRKYNFSKGNGQLFNLEDYDSKDFFHLSMYGKKELIYDKLGNKQVYPLVIILGVLSDNVNDDTILQTQTTFATFVETDGHYKVKVLKQKIDVDGQCYELQEIYGIEGSATAQAKTDGKMVTNANKKDKMDDNKNEIEVEDGTECVICMTEPRDTTLLPCRHMCLCGVCAESLRSKSSTCPVCRTKVESLLQIKVAEKEKQKQKETK